MKISKTKIKKQVESIKYYCHATRKENIPSILEKGLLANEAGEIFVYDDVYARVRFKAEGKSFYIGDEIAYNQLFIFDEEYAVFYIDKSEIVGEVVDDNVGELISPFQHIIRQDCIKPAGYLIRKRELYT